VTNQAYTRPARLTLHGYTAAFLWYNALSVSIFNDSLKTNQTIDFEMNPTHPGKAFL